jgi:uncharacterized protein (DUF58 family)
MSKTLLPPSLPVTPAVTDSSMILIDLSRSMDSIEEGASRLEKAREVLNRELKESRGRQVGLMVFAGKVFALSPLTTDTLGLSLMISQLSTDTLRQAVPDTSGSNIGDALIAGTVALS